MTILGLLLVVLGVYAGLVNQTQADGRWLLGFAVAAFGLFLIWRDRRR